MTCDFRDEPAHYATKDDLVQFCYWHTLILYLGYAYMGL